MYDNRYINYNLLLFQIPRNHKGMMHRKCSKEVFFRFNIEKLIIAFHMNFNIFHLRFDPVV